MGKHGASRNNAPAPHAARHNTTVTGEHVPPPYDAEALHRAVKALTESGRTEDPAKVAQIFYPDRTRIDPDSILASFDEGPARQSLLGIFSTATMRIRTGGAQNFEDIESAASMALVRADVAVNGNPHNVRSFLTVTRPTTLMTEAFTTPEEIDLRSGWSEEEIITNGIVRTQIPLKGRDIEIGYAPGDADESWMTPSFITAGAEGDVVFTGAKIASPERYNEQLGHVWAAPTRAVVEYVERVFNPYGQHGTY